MSIALLIAFAASAANPLAPALEGKLRCNAPNVAAKTCRAITSYKAAGAGQYETNATIMLNAEPLVTLETINKVTVTGSALCSKIGNADIDAAKISFAGSPLDTATSAPIRDKIKEGMAAVIGHDLCQTFVSEGGKTFSTATVDGQPHEEMKQELIWVGPADGYKVGP